MRNRMYGGVRGRKVSLPYGKLTFLLLDFVSVFVDWSIDETKEPEGYFVAETCFDVVGHDVAVGQVGNL